MPEEEIKRSRESIEPWTMEPACITLGTSRNARIHMADGVGAMVHHYQSGSSVPLFMIFRYPA